MKYLIIGGVAGGATAAARIRRNTEKAEIILLEKGGYISYANCGLPYYLGNVIQEREKLFVQTPEAFGKRFNIDVRVHQEAIEINPEKKTVLVSKSDGTRYEESYDKLLLSPGASPVVPPLKGIDSNRIFTLRNVEDTDRIKNFMQTALPTKAVIVGGGFIGLEMAENLVHAGMEVYVVEMANQVMGPIDYSMAALVHEHLQQKGVALYLEKAVESFEDLTAAGSHHAMKVNLSSGESIETDMVILSIGVRPNTQLASQAGLEIGSAKGIKVNRYLQTSNPDIYAVGDAIEYPHPITSLPWLNYLAGPTNRQARIVADNMVYGNTQEYEGSIGTSIAKVFDLTVASTGMAAKRLRQLGIAYQTATIHSGSNASYYPGALQMDIKIVFSPHDGKLLGAQIVGFNGVDKRIDQMAQVIKQGGDIYQLSRTEHAYAPPFSSAKDPVAVAGYVAQNILSGKMNPIYWRELQKAQPGSIFLIDVRTPDEFATGSLSGAVNIPLDDLRSRMSEIPSNVPVVLFCGVGLRGYLASNILKDNGYTDVRNLIGGLKTYKAAVAKVLTPEEMEKEKMKSGLSMGETSLGIRPAATLSEALFRTGSGNCHCESSSDTEGKKVIRIDACGLQCPGPILKLKKNIDSLQSGEILEITSTDAGFPRDAEAWCHSTGHHFLGKSSQGGTYTVQIEKASACSLAQTQMATPETGNRDNKTFILFSDDLDKALATFVLANGAAATGKKVSIFFTFWGLNAIKKEHKPVVKKDFMGKMFSMMLPSNSKKLKLSKMNMAGIGSRMMRNLMKDKGIESLESLREQAIENGVEFIACQMSMDVMGVKKEELLDNVTIGGVATYMERAEKAGLNLFI